MRVVHEDQRRPGYELVRVEHTAEQDGSHGHGPVDGDRDPHDPRRIARRAQRSAQDELGRVGDGIDGQESQHRSRHFGDLATRIRKTRGKDQGHDHDNNRKQR